MQPVEGHAASGKQAKEVGGGIGVKPLPSAHRLHQVAQEALFILRAMCATLGMTAKGVEHKRIYWKRNKHYATPRHYKSDKHSGLSLETV